MSARLTIALTALLSAAALAQEPVHERMDRLEAEIERAEDVRAIKRLQRAYGYYLDKGLWADLAELFADDAVASYPAGVYVGRESIRRHLYMNVGRGEMGVIGLGDGRLYNHMSIQPVVHLGPAGETAEGRWRAFAMFGRYGGSAIWAEGVYEIDYVKDDGAWKIRTLDYHAGFAAPYETGWVAPEDDGTRPPRNLPHAPDRERDVRCEGFPEACLAPFHYDNPGTSESGHIWADARAGDADRARADAAERAAELERRAQRLSDEREIENLQRIYGYYLDRRMWDHVADLFAEDGTIELGLRGVYEGRERVREFLELLGPEGLRDGELNDHAMLQTIVTVASDGRTAKLRGRELAMTGAFDSHGEWSEGIYENTFVKLDGVWKIESLRYYPTFITDYDAGWARDARQPAGPSETLPPDRPPTERYEIYPAAHVPPFHYDNPVTGEPPQYPRGEGRPSRAAIRAVRAEVGPAPTPRPGGDAQRDVEVVLAAAERAAARYKDYHEIENLTNAYGYYLDKNLWNDLADLFAEDGSIELAQRGVYEGRDRVRGFLLAVFGRGGVEGPVAGRLGNHVQMQPVIHIAPDGRSAQVRSRALQQLNFGAGASLGAAIYENAAVKENGVWKLSRVHAYNTWTAGYEGGWHRDPGRSVPGPSEDYPPDAPPTLEFEMFPNVYRLPFHYRNPVSGRRAYAYLDGDADSGGN